MGRLFRLNSLYEYEISGSSAYFKLKKEMFHRAHLFEYFFLLLSETGDYTFLRKNVDSDLLEYWRKSGISFGYTIENTSVYEEYIRNKSYKLKNNDSDIDQLIEWGRYFKLEKNKLIKDETAFSLGRVLNSKSIQTDWKSKAELHPFRADIVSSIEELDEKLKTYEGSCVIKLPYHFSGRGHIVLKKSKDLAHKRLVIHKFLLEEGKLVIEEWQNSRKSDFSVLCDFKDGEFTVLATTQMLIDDRGMYRGTIITNKIDSLLEETVSNALLKLKAVSSGFHNYTGSASVDGYTFIDSDGSEKFQPISEINFRHSMGRIAFDIFKKIGEGKSYALLFLPADKDIVKDYFRLKSNLEDGLEARIHILTPAFSGDFMTIYVEFDTEKPPLDF